MPATGPGPGTRIVFDDVGRDACRRARGGRARRLAVGELAGGRPPVTTLSASTIMSMSQDASPSPRQQAAEAASVPLTRTFEEICELARHGAPPTSDDVWIAHDGRRLDTAEKILAYLAEPHPDEVGPDDRA